jgi:hypothetical protein
MLMGVRTGVGAVAMVLLVVSSCSRGRDDATLPGSTTPDVMRSVPTVPVGTVGDPALVSTIVSPPPPPPPLDPNAPIVSVAPPPTELVGDPQPIPNATNPPPPTAPPSDDAPLPPDACTRLASFGIEQVVSERSGQSAESELLSADVCRISSGDLVAEIAFISLDAFRNDWSRRDGIEPVGDVSGDAVGLASFQTPSGGSGVGYTIAVAGGDRGVVVSASAPSDARLLAADVAVFAQQAG